MNAVAQCFDKFEWACGAFKIIQHIDSIWIQSGYIELSGIN